MATQDEIKFLANPNIGSQKKNTADSKIWIKACRLQR